MMFEKNPAPCYTQWILSWSTSAKWSTHTHKKILQMQINRLTRLSLVNSPVTLDLL